MKHYDDCEIDQLIMFYYCELQKMNVRDDYHELIEFSIRFLGGDKEKLKIRHPGAMHQVWWMTCDIYSLKMFVAVSFQNKHKGKTSIEICLLIYCNSLCEALAWV